MRAPRGQNLTLFALTMLLVALMVIITLGLAQRIRENHELNNLADAAAYSSAVVNARAFNNIAIMNRLQVSYWVSMTANESLISWTSYGRALWNATYDALDMIADDRLPTGPLGGSGDCTELKRRALNASLRVQADFGPYWAGWRAADNLAGSETRQIQGRIAALRAETRDGPGGMRYRLFEERRVQNIAKQILMEAGVTDVAVVPAVGGPLPVGGAAGVSSREVGDYGLDLYTNCSLTQSGLCVGTTAAGHWSNSVLEAAMGTRGNSFVLRRGVLPPILTTVWGTIDTLFPGTFTFTDGMPTGSGYFDRTMSHGTTADETFAWADDHGSLTLRAVYRGCSAVIPNAARSHVKTTDLLETADQHQWSPRARDIEGGDPNPEQWHTAGDCTPLCPSVWVRQVNFNPYHNPDEAYGQPKSQVLMVRDTRLSTSGNQPWKLNFRFGFGATPVQFDNRGEELHGDSAGAGLVIKSQSAVATGMTYYHRKDQWLEYPNLLNPFWRATLVPANVDRTGNPLMAGTDMADVLRRPTEQWQNDAYRALVFAGYQGVH